MCPNRAATRYLVERLKLPVFSPHIPHLFPWLKLHFETQTTTCQRQHLWCKRYFAVITTNGLALNRGIFVVVQSNARFWSLPWLYLKHGICAFCYISGCSCMDAIDIRLGYIHTDFIWHTSFYNFRSCIIALTLCLVMQQVTNRSVVMPNWLVYQDFHCKTYNLFMVLMMSTLYIIVQYCNYIPINFWTHLLPAVLHIQKCLIFHFNCFSNIIRVPKNQPVTPITELEPRQNSDELVVVRHERGWQE